MKYTYLLGFLYFKQEGKHFVILLLKDRSELREWSYKEKIVGSKDATVRWGVHCPLQPEKVVELCLEGHKEGKEDGSCPASCVSSWSEA